MIAPARAALSPSFSIGPETAFDAAAVDDLVLGAFGPGRFAKTAERLREGACPAVGLVAREGASLVGSVRLWPIRIGDVPALFLGPIAVRRDRQGAGLGQALVEAAVEAASPLETAGVLLVGDLPFFGRFGFDVVDDVVLPGPVASSRLLWRGLGGAVRPRGPVRRA